MTTSISPSEVFVPITGWEKSHQISNKGRVFSRGKPLKPFMNNGYWCVNLKANGVAELVRIHRLVGTHFLPHTGVDRHLFICHRDDIRDRYEVKDLFIGTRTDNMKDAWKNGKWNHRIAGNRFTVNLDF